MTIGILEVEPKKKKEFIDCLMNLLFGDDRYGLKDRDILRGTPNQNRNVWIIWETFWSNLFEIERVKWLRELIESLVELKWDYGRCEFSVSFFLRNWKMCYSIFCFVVFDLIGWFWTEKKKLRFLKPGHLLVINKNFEWIKFIHPFNSLLNLINNFY